MILETRIYDPCHIPLANVTILISVKSGMYITGVYKGYYDHVRGQFRIYLVHSNNIRTKQHALIIDKENIKHWRYD